MNNKTKTAVALIMIAVTATFMGCIDSSTESREADRAVIYAEPTPTATRITTGYDEDATRITTGYDEDSEWASSCKWWCVIIQEDLNAIAESVQYGEMSVMEASVILRDDADQALTISQLFTVSSQYSYAKREYESALVDFNAAGMMGSIGEYTAAGEYVQSATKHMQSARKHLG